VTLATTVGMFNGDKIKLQLDNGSSFTTTITTIAGNTVNLASPLPSQSSSGRLFTNTAQQARSQSTGGTGSTGAITTSLAGAAALGATSVSVTSAAGLVTGDAVQLQLADGSTLLTTITGITGSTSLSADALANTQSLAVTNAAGFSTGDTVKLTLDSGALFSTFVAGVVGNTITLAAPLPGQASTGSLLADPTHIMVGLATALPVPAASGGTLTDTAGVAAASNPITVSTTLGATAPGGATSLTLASAGGMAVGDALQVQLTNGAVFNTKVASIAGSVVTIAAPLPTQALSGNTVIDTVPTTGSAASVTPTVALSPETIAMLQLQLSTLVAAANPTADPKTLQTIEATLLGSTLTGPQFQQNLTALVQLATKSLSATGRLSILA